MSIKQGHIPKDQRKKILFLADDLRSYSGVAVMAREIVIGTSHIFNWVSIGGLQQHQDQGKRLDLSIATSQEAGIDDASVILYPVSGYGDPDILREVIRYEKPDAVFIFTDPRYWVWLFNMEHEIRKNIPLVYLNIWDSLPYPYYNKSFYEACDALFAISKQTENINRVVLGEDAEDKVIKYVPHGINEDRIYPIQSTDPQLINFKRELFGNEEYDVVYLFNARNLRRKSVSDVILAFGNFVDHLRSQRSNDNVALLMHTTIRDEQGTDLEKVVKDVLGEGYNIIFDERKYTQEGINLLYNSADVVVLTSSNEGWGLSLTEGMMAGKPIIANTTGGMQDQMRFSRANGKWIEFSHEFGSNHKGQVQSHGEWAFPIYPSNHSIVGSLETPYIYEDRASIEDISNAMDDVYDLKINFSTQYNIICDKARAWVLSDESMMSAKNMSKNIVDGFNEVFEKFKPRERYTIEQI